MGEELKKPKGFLDDLMDKAQERALSSIPMCEICGGTLMGGSLTISHSGTPLIVCMKCVFRSVEFYLTQRENRLKGK